jgi:hypothetical protein
MNPRRLLSDTILSINAASELTAIPLSHVGRE